MEKLMSLFKKYEEIIMYLIVGFMTTIVSVLVFFIFTKLFHVNYMISNFISWIISVLFAYIANKYLVFKSVCDNKKAVFLEIYQFFKYRVLSFIIDTLLMYFFIEIMNIGDMISKVIVQVIVIVLNYVFSKLFVFKK